MIAALVLAAAAARAAEPPAAARLEAALSDSASARRLFAGALDAPRREAHASGLPRAVDERGGARPEIVLDLERLRALPPGEAQAEYAYALARAEIAAPVPLVEAEQAARQRVVTILAEEACADPALSAALRAAELKPVPGAPVLSRAAADLLSFERDPASFYWEVESGGGVPREAARLAEVEDLLALRGAAVRAMDGPPRGPYADLDGRRVPAALARAALVLRAPGAVQRAREALGAYDAVGVEPTRAAIARWRAVLKAPSGAAILNR